MPVLLTRETWLKMARDRFGDDDRKWVFRCPACGTNQSAAMFMKFKIPPRGRAYKACIGGFLQPNRIGACTYHIAKSPIRLGTKFAVIDLYGVPQQVFDFGELPPQDDPRRAWLTYEDIENAKLPKSRVHTINERNKVETIEIDDGQSDI